MRKKGKVPGKKRAPIAGREYCDSCSYGQGYCGIRMMAPLRVGEGETPRIAGLAFMLAEMLESRKQIKIVSCSDWADPKKRHPLIRTVTEGDIRFRKTRGGYTVERSGKGEG